MSRVRTDPTDPLYTPESSPSKLAESLLDGGAAVRTSFVKTRDLSLAYESNTPVLSNKTAPYRVRSCVPADSSVGTMVAVGELTKHIETLIMDHTNATVLLLQDRLTEREQEFRALQAELLHMKSESDLTRHVCGRYAASARRWYGEARRWFHDTFSSENDEKDDAERRHAGRASANWNLRLPPRPPSPFELPLPRTHLPIRGSTDEGRKLCEKKRKRRSGSSPLSSHRLKGSSSSKSSFRSIVKSASASARRKRSKIGNAKAQTRGKAIELDSSNSPVPSHAPSSAEVNKNSTHNDDETNEQKEFRKEIVDNVYDAERKVNFPAKHQVSKPTERLDVIYREKSCATSATTTNNEDSGSKSPDLLADLKYAAYLSAPQPFNRSNVTGTEDEYETPGKRSVAKSKEARLVPDPKEGNKLCRATSSHSHNGLYEEEKREFDNNRSKTKMINVKEEENESLPVVQNKKNMDSVPYCNPDNRNPNDQSDTRRALDSSLCKPLSCTSGNTTCSIPLCRADAIPDPPPGSSSVSNDLSTSKANHIIEATTEKNRYTGSKSSSSFTKSTCCRQMESKTKNKPETQRYRYSEVVRDKNERRAMSGHTCEQCQAFVKAVCGAKNKLGEFVFDAKDMVQKCSRHRSRSTPPQTPHGFWELSFADSIAARKK